jgi:hypothetical protein
MRGVRPSGLDDGRWPGRRARLDGRTSPHERDNQPPEPGDRSVHGRPSAGRASGAARSVARVDRQPVRGVHDPAGHQHRQGGAAVERAQARRVAGERVLGRVRLPMWSGLDLPRRDQLELVGTGEGGPSPTRGCAGPAPSSWRPAGVPSACRPTRTAPGGRPVRRLTPTGSGTAPIGGGRARSGPPRPPAARRSEGRLGPSLRRYPPAGWAGSNPARHWPFVQPHACRPLPGGYGPGAASYFSSVDCSPQVALVPSSSTSSIASEVMKRLGTAPCQWSWPGSKNPRLPRWMARSDRRGPVRGRCPR